MTNLPLTSTMSPGTSSVAGSIEKQPAVATLNVKKMNLTDLSVKHNIMRAICREMK